MTDPETFYQQVYHNLLILKEREARYRNRARVPATLLDQIENHERAIFLTRQRLDGLMSEYDWREALKSLELADVSAEPGEGETAADVEPAHTTEPDVLPPITEYRLANIRDLLTTGFSDTELRNFCFDQPEFREVYEQLAEQTGKEEIISLLMEHADQNLLFEMLLAWAKERNPARYKRHQPYTNIQNIQPSNLQP
ncbi:MAG: hypothetical protein BroJett011_48690 [Chloroflexota bacterium]|nr:MAG: hypothetical protein BroJett011_48690 [Chloroflexota bacterium]